jgi:kynurenine formamidase
VRRLPNYQELPEASEGGRSAWGLFGDTDNLGLINLLTPERVLRASTLIRKGSVFSLNAKIDAFIPAIAESRGAPRHHVVRLPGDTGFDDLYDNFYPQASSQWDALAHAGYTNNVFYNGATAKDIEEGCRNTIDHWAEHGIVGRAVILDMQRTLADEGRQYDVGGAAFTVEDLELARSRSGISYEYGDILIIHTGFAKWFMEQSRSRRYQVKRSGCTPGIANGEEMCEYLWDSHVAAVASDTYAVEVFPPASGDATGFLHRILIGQFGMALGELWWTDALASDCNDDGVYEAFLASAPLNAPGGIGSPANAVAIK